MALSTPIDGEPALSDEKSEIPTPALVVDLDIMERNAEEYATFAEEHDVRLRSHVKTHKIPWLAHYQNELTGGGILCQTLSEAAVMAENGIDDIYLSYMVVGEEKLEHLTWLSDRVDHFATTVDCPGNIHPLQEVAERRGTTVNVVLEIDVGLNRVGVAPGEPAVEMAEMIQEQPNLKLEGVMGYEGHIGYIMDEVETHEDYEQKCANVMDTLEETVDMIQVAGVEIDEVKVGSTATSRYSGKHPVVSEINPGMYIFNDANLVRCVPDITIDDCALSVLTTVISKPTEDRIVADAGSKTISFDIDQSPMTKGDENIDYYNASEEHAWIDIEDTDTSVEVGDRLEFIPPHVCTTLNLHDALIGVRDGTVEEVWEIQARGKLV